VVVGNSRQLDYEYYNATYGVGSGHPQNNPLLITETSLGHATLESVTVLWPRGGLWTVGFQLVLAGTVIVPQGGNLTFATGDDHEHTYEVGLEVDTGLQVALYNLGSFFHTVYVTYKVSNIGDKLATQQAQDAAAAAASAGAAASAPSNPITVIPTAPSTTEVPPVSTVTVPPAALPGASPGVDPNDPVIVNLQQQITQLQQTVASLQTELAQLQIMPATPSTSTTSPTSPSVTSSASPAPVGPMITLGGPGTVVTNPDQSTTNPYNPNGSLNITALGQIATANGGAATIVTPTGGILPVTSGMLGGHPYTCIGSSC
jgi:hypothetical protein